VTTRPDVTAIIGGGASGILTALQLLRADCPPERLVVVEPRSDLGKGIAYGTTDIGHFLNVRAGRMSALPDHPSHFTEWAAKRTPSDALSFLPRAWYGEYLASLLGPVEHVRARALDLLPVGSRVQVALSDGTRVEVDRAVLAPGSSPPAWPTPIGPTPIGAGGRRWIPDPWAPGALSGLRPGDPVLLVGTGLTAVDIALSLQAAGHRVVATSRHGLLPQAHTDRPPVTIRCTPPDRPNARSLVAWARATATEVGDWAPVVDSLRCHTNQLWQGMEGSERVRLLRHLHRKWEVLRHRMPPQVAARIRNMQETGQLKVVAGGVRSVNERSRGLDVELSDGVFGVSAIVNCTGPTADVTSTTDPLVRRLLDRRVARPGPLQLGLDTDSTGCLPNTDYKLWLVGPLRRGMNWETTAVPEIREQAALLSTSLRRAPELVAV
jgi:uncharacterized NAD(P)/FAD-binding protein YdhS